MTLDRLPLSEFGRNAGYTIRFRLIHRWVNPGRVSNCSLGIIGYQSLKRSYSVFSDTIHPRVRIVFLLMKPSDCLICRDRMTLYSTGDLPHTE